MWLWTLTWHEACIHAKRQFLEEVSSFISNFLKQGISFPVILHVPAAGMSTSEQFSCV